MRISEFRSQAKVMLAIVVVAFVGLIFFQWGMNITSKIRGQVPRDVIGKVDDQNIKVKDYIESVRQLMQQIPGSPTLTLIDSVRNLAWQELIAEMIYAQLMDKEGLYITSDEIKEIIKSNPPPEIANLPQLKNEKGEFDFQKYHQLLRDRRNISWVLDYELRIRKEYPKRKVNIALATAGWLTPGEIEILTRVFSCRFTGSIISFPVSIYTAQIDTSREALFAYYNQTLEEWQRPERRQCQYVFFPKEPSSNDTNDLNRRREDLEEDLKTDVEFHVLAEEYTNDPRISLAISELDDNIKTKMKRARIGAITKIPQDNQFLYLKRINKDSIQQIILKVLISNQTIYDLQDRMSSFISNAKEIGFEKACDEWGLKPSLTYPLEEGKINLKQLRDPGQLSRFAFEAKLDDLSDPLVGAGGYYVFRLYTISPATTISFEKISHWLKNRYIKDKALELAEKKAWEFYNRAAAGEDINNIIKNFQGIEVVRLAKQPLSKMKTVYGAEMIGTILGLKRTGVAKPISTSWIVYLPIIDKLDQEAISEVLNYVTRLRQFRAEFVFQKTLESFKVEDFRSYEIE